jgi:membrane protease YdiL (CAAX protease family)
MASSTTPEAPEARETLRLAAVTLVWLACARYLESLGNALVPDAWKVKIQLQTFLIACQITMAAVGLGLAFALLARPRDAIALVRPRARGVAVAALLGPAAYVGSAAVAFQVALPTLLAELQERGTQAPRQDAGELGRMLQQGPTLATLIWGVVLAAISEELLFRGALWSLVARVAGHLDRARPEAPEAARGRLRAAVPAIAATVVSAVAFSAMHANLAAGVGILRVVSTLCLGLACGAARGATGALAAPIAVHLINNVLSLAPARGWFGRDLHPVADWLPVPSVVVGLAVAGAAAAAVVLVGSTIVRRRAERDRALRLEG